MIRELTNHLWQSTLFALAAALLTLAFRVNRAHVRYWLWLSASLKFLLPFALLMSLGHRLASAPVARKIATPEVSIAIGLIAQPFPSRLPSVPAPNRWIPAALLLAWTCGFLAIAVMRLRLWLRIRAAVGASSILQIRAPVEIRSSVGLLEPGVVGCLRPVLLLPEGILQQLTPPQFEAVLAHELCHVRRRENLFASIQMSVEAFFWFYPLVWWIGARLVEERERACDEDVLSLGSDPRIYADAILSVCRLYVESPLVCVSGVTGSGLKRRIEAIMKNRRSQNLNRAKKFLLACAAAAALVCPVVVGVIIAVGHAPIAHAQSPALGRRLVALIFDFGAMTSDEQSRARQSAIDFVHDTMKPTDLVAVITAESGSARIVQDFTGNPALLQSAIANLAAGSGAASGLSGLESAAKLLAVFPEKKSLVYFSSHLEQPGTNNQAALQSAIDTAKKSNAAIYPVDAQGIIPKMIAQSGASAGGGRSMMPQTPPAGSSQDEYNRRTAYARANYGSPASEMGRIYVRYGQPDQVENNSANAQTWRYNYLENLHSTAAFEFTLWNGHYHMRIAYPPPLATYEGSPTAGAEGLPGRHASFQIYPSTELQMLSVPFDSLSGAVDLQAQIKTSPGASGQNVAAVAGFRDSVQGGEGPYQVNFILPTGAYVCTLTVREQATGRSFGETIFFGVK